MTSAAWKISLPTSELFLGVDSSSSLLFRHLQGMIGHKTDFFKDSTNGSELDFFTGK